MLEPLQDEIQSGSGNVVSLFLEAPAPLCDEEISNADTNTKDYNIFPESNIPHNISNNSVRQNITEVRRHTYCQTLSLPKNAPRARTHLGRFACGGRVLFLHSDGENILCMDVLADPDASCVWQRRQHFQPIRLFAHPTLYNMDIGRHLKVTDFEVDEKSNGTLVLAVKLVGVYGEEHVEVVQICSETWHAWILFSGRIVEFCQNKNVHPYEGQLTLPVTDGIRVSDQNALLISSTGCITLVDWFNDCIITLVSNSVINNMDIKHNYLIYVETIDNCTRLVTIDLDVIWSSSIVSGPIVLDELPAARIHLDARSPNAIQMGVQSGNFSKLGRRNRILLLEIFTSNDCSTGFAFNAWMYHLKSDKKTDLGQRDSEQDVVHHSLVLELVIQAPLPVPPGCVRVDISALSECSRVILRCTDGTGQQQYNTLLIFWPQNHLESANPLGNVSACFSLKPLAVDNINEEKCGAEAVRKVAVDTLSSTLCWSSYMDDKIRISFFD